MLTWWRFKNSMVFEVVDFEDRKRAEEKFYEEVNYHLWGYYPDCPIEEPCYLMGPDPDSDLHVEEYDGGLLLLDGGGIELMSMTKECEA